MLRMSDVESSATAQQVPKRLLRWRAHFCSKASQWHKIKRHDIQSPKQTSTSLQFTFPLPYIFLKHLSNQSIIFTVAYQFLKLIRILLQREWTIFYPKLKGKNIFRNSLFFHFSPLLCGIICFNFALTTSAMAFYLINLKKQLVLAILIRTSKDN